MKFITERIESAVVGHQVSIVPLALLRCIRSLAAIARSLGRFRLLSREREDLAVVGALVEALARIECLWIGRCSQPHELELGGVDSRLKEATAVFRCKEKERLNLPALRGNAL